MSEFCKFYRVHLDYVFFLISSQFNKHEGRLALSLSHSETLRALYIKREPSGQNFSIDYTLPHSTRKGHLLPMLRWEQSYPIHVSFLWSENWFNCFKIGCSNKVNLPEWPLQCVVILLECFLFWLICKWASNVKGQSEFNSSWWLAW